MVIGVGRKGRCPMKTALKGIIHGKVIETEDEPGAAGRAGSFGYLRTCFTRHIANRRRGTGSATPRCRGPGRR